MKRAWLLAGTAAVLCLGVGCSAPESKEAIWRRLELQLEGPHLWQNAIGWRPVYNDMIELGFHPREAARRIRKAARYGPQLPNFIQLLRKAQSPEELALALDDVARRSREELRLADRGLSPLPTHGYPHERIYVDERTKLWRELAHRLEHSPYFANPLGWQPVYFQMLDLGLSHEKASAYVLRAAKVGPPPAEVARILEETSDLAELRRKLAVEQSLSADRLYETEGDWYSYWHFPKGAEKWLEERAKAERERARVRRAEIPPEVKEEMERRRREAERAREEAEAAAAGEGEVEPDYPEADLPEVGLPEEGVLEEFPELEEDFVDETGPEAPPALEGPEAEEPGSGDLPPEEEFGDEPPIDDLGDQPPVEDEDLEEGDQELPGLGDE
ncbi:MAG: hypothetical protein D6731_06945 [Planctomycetota bacterium]|nr:MAG: hypothetical protein D6731_06945 [Planctomycetota bacterium]